MPEALSAEAVVDLPVVSALLSLPFYLLCLLLASVHVLVCTSATSSCYFCTLSWGLVFAAVAFSSAMFCILVSMALRRLSPGPRSHGKVSLNALYFRSLQVCFAYLWYISIIDRVIIKKKKLHFCLFFFFNFIRIVTKKHTKNTCIIVLGLFYVNGVFISIS